jgi:SAM-dependent methyltransferase
VVVSDSTQARMPAEVVWHDLECGGYRADLPVWHELAQTAGGRVLDVGSGSGRVTLQLARAGHAVTALDRSDMLLAALRERAAGLDVEAACADARSFALQRRDFALCIVPMQTIQLLGGAKQRIAFLRCAREHVRPGATIALAILGELDTFDCSRGTIGPAAERAYADGLLYLSRAVRVSETAELVEIERERRVMLPEADACSAASADVHAVYSERGPEIDLIELDRVSVASLEAEGAEAGLHAEPPLEIAATDEHVGSWVVMLRA